MRCTQCDAIIPEGWMSCPRCGREVQIVPDYNPLEDVLTQEVKDSVEDVTRQIFTEEIRNYNRKDIHAQKNYTRVIERVPYQKKGTPKMQNIESNTQPNKMEQKRDSVEEQRRKHAIRRKRMKQRRRKRAAILGTLLIVICIPLGWILYQNSYTGQVKKGYLALQMEEYDVAKRHFERAIEKDQEKEDAYRGMLEIYEKQDQLEEAEKFLISSVSASPNQVGLYQAAIAYYEETEQLGKISILLEECEEEKVLEAVKAYVSKAPQFSLREGKYDEVQEITVSAEDGTKVYYTVDGSDPTKDGILYEEPIRLTQEGVFEVKAVAYNEKEIPSVVVSQTYEIEFPIADAPAVTPSTGQYYTATQITIQVPEGYTAYYTLDGTEPNENSLKYTEPIAMPKGQTIFSAVLISKSGKQTAVTKRNYLYE